MPPFLDIIKGKCGWLNVDEGSLVKWSGKVVKDRKVATKKTIENINVVTKRERKKYKC